jgi:hypothetical protein
MASCLPGNPGCGEELSFIGDEPFFRTIIGNPHNGATLQGVFDCGASGNSQAKNGYLSTG